MNDSAHYRGSVRSGSYLETFDDAVMIIAEDGTVSSLNRAAEDLLGVAAEDVVGRRYDDPVIGLHHAAGRPLHPGEYPYEVWRRDHDADRAYIAHAEGSRALVNISFRELGAGGQDAPVALSMSTVDGSDDLKEEIDLLIRENERLRGELHEQVHLLGGISQMGSLIASLERPTDIVRQVSEYGRIAFDVDTALVLQQRDESGGYFVTGQSGETSTSKTAELPAEVVEELGMLRPAPFLMHDIKPLMDIPLFGALAQHGISQTVAMPLLTESRCHGILLLADRRKVPTGAEHLAAFGLFAIQASTALQNARRMRTDQEVSARLQAALLGIPIEKETLRSGHIYESAADLALIGGDFYDLFDLPDGRVAALIGDVSGKGLDAAVLTLLVRHTLRAYAYDTQSPAEVLRKTNELIMELYPQNSFVTMFYCTLDPDSGHIVYSSGGHPPAMIRRAGGEVEVLEANAIAIGALSDGIFRQDETGLRPDDVLLLYTDGLTEARVGDGFLGETGLMRLLEETRDVPVEEMPERLLRALRAMPDVRLHDDTAVLALGL